MIKVRPATEADVPQMLTIYNDIILTTTAVFDYKPHSLEMRMNWFNDKKEKGHPVFVTHESEEIIGFSSYGSYRTWAAYQYTVENSVYAAQKKRGKGIGKLLLLPLIETAERIDLHTIIASIEATNEASIRLHQQFGFVEAAHFKQVGYKFGKWVDLKFFQLLLTTPKQPVEWFNNEKNTLI